MSIRLKSLSLEKAVATKIHMNRMARRLEREAYMNQIYTHFIKNLLTDCHLQQELVIGPYSEPDESIPHSDTLTT